MGHGSTPANSPSTFLRHSMSPSATAPLRCCRMALTPSIHFRMRASVMPTRRTHSNSADANGYDAGSRITSSNAASSISYRAVTSRAPRDALTVSSPASSRPPPPYPPEEASSTAANSASSNAGDTAAAVAAASARAVPRSRRSPNHTRVAAGSARRATR